MKRTLITVMVALAILTGVYSIAGAASGVHIDYRTGYSGGCGGGTACHSVTKGSFLPSTLDTTAAPNEKDYTSFCLACHNAAGEAHSKSAGSPSNNVYINGTGLVPGTGGDSHSWNGQNHNAGTRTPASAGFRKTVDGSDFMPGGRVTCQTCHDSMNKTAVQNIENWAPATLQSGTSYTFGYAKTRQYLAKYIEVYRSSASMTKPANTRTKNQYLVDPSEYTYNPINGTITFNTSQGSNYIYVEISEPYLRVDNTANAVCLDCHNDRVSGSVSHAPGTGAKNGHPVAINYGYNFGIQSTIQPNPQRNAYVERTGMETSKVYCTSCHDPHNAASKDGMIMREADDQTLCGNCHKTKLDGYSTAGSVNIHNGSKHSSPTVCADCHTTHNSNNIMLIRNVINGKVINFQNFTGANSFGNDNGSSICEACHAATIYHKSDGTGTGHNTGKNCLECHKHETGFGGGGCSGCHGYPPDPTKAGPYGWADTSGDKHSNHMDYILTKYGLSGNDACGTCHGSSMPRNDHNTDKDTAGIDTSSAIYWNGGTFSIGTTIGKTSTADDSCTNVACHSSGGTRPWGGTGPATCDTCHPYPGSATNEWTNYNGHVVRKDTTTVTHMMATGYNAATDTYAAMVADTTRCGKCHPNVPSNHDNGTINLSAAPYACGGGNITINQTVTRSNVTCDSAVCHNTRTTPNWW